MNGRMVHSAGLYRRGSLNRLQAIRQAIIETRGEFEVELPSRPDPNVDPGDEDDWLFCSEREYTEQLAVYKGRKQPF